MKKEVHRVQESHLKEYFELTKNMFGGEYRKFVEKFIKTKNISNKMSTEDMAVMQSIINNLHLFQNVQFYQWDGMDNVDEIVEGQA